jgi:thiol:disulfide interchange protein
MMKWRAFGILSVLLLATACGRGKVDIVGVGPSDANDTSAPIISTKTSTGQPTIKVANWEETQQLVAQNAGKVVVLDLWATW